MSLGILIFLLLLSLPAGAYNYESPVGHGCHEALTSAALREVRRQHATAAPLATSGADALIVGDLVFGPAGDMRDIGAVSLLLGVRDNDLKGHSGVDTQELAGVHGDENSQREHCLRRSEHDEPNGSEAAVNECRAFVRERVHRAIDEGLDADGRVDPAKRTAIRVKLAFRGSVLVSLPTFYVLLGQGLHTLQDSFSHTFRSADHRRARVAMNWVDVVDGDIDEARDGPAHMAAFDECSDLDAFRRKRLEAARAASAAIIAAALDEAHDAAGRRAAVDQVLGDYLSYEPGCTHDNRWCDAVENEYADSACGCHTVGANTHAGWWLTLVLAAGLCWRRVGAACLIALPATAHAQEVERDQTGFGASLAFSASIDNGAFAWALGGRYAITNRWLVGLDVEYNPWFSVEAGRFGRGVFNSYASGIHRYAVTEHLALRSCLQLGASVMLVDLVGVPKGSTGPFFGANLLGLSFEMGEQIYLIVDPAHVVVPMPKASGAPFTYHQYRFTVGIQLGA